MNIRFRTILLQIGVRLRFTNGLSFCMQLAFQVLLLIRFCETQMQKIWVAKALYCCLSHWPPLAAHVVHEYNKHVANDWQ